MKKITIGIFNDSFYPMSDGVVMVVDNYAKRLCKYANVIVFVPEYPEGYDDSKFPYKVVRCHSFDVPFLDYVLPTPDLDLKFKLELDKYNLDIVHIHSPFTLGLVGIHYAKKNNIPCIATMHSQFKQDFYKATHLEGLSKLLTDDVIRKFEKCDECWAVNKEVARIYHEEYGYEVMPKVMNNATEMKPVKSIKKANNYINKLYNIDKNTKVFLFVGRINTLKNILFIVESLALLKQNHPNFKFKMLFVGSGQDEELLKNHIDKYNMSNEIIMCGKVMDRTILEYYYARANLFLFPSLYDASSLVQIEASAQKTPTLFIKGSATSATVDENINGYMALNETSDYANKIYDIFSEENKYNNVCLNAYNDLYKNWDDVVKDVYKKYIKLIKKGRKS